MATNEVDFLKSGLNEVTFASGSATAVLSIPIVDDKYVEFDEEFYVDIMAVDGMVQNGRVVISIGNDDGEIFLLFVCSGLNARVIFQSVLFVVYSIFVFVSMW